MAFFRGQKVVCVYDRLSRWNRFRAFFFPPPGGMVRAGAVYTVANVFVSDEDTMLELYELPAPRNRHWEAGFKASCFRPLTERKTSIEVFQKLLASSPETVGA